MLLGLFIPARIPSTSKAGGRYGGKIPGKEGEDGKASNIGLIAALGKKKVKLSLSEEAEWEDYFMQESAKARILKARIDDTDKEIDQMVYELYGLTEEEVETVEKGQGVTVFCELKP